jgi:hypothetical protein
VCEWRCMSLACECGWVRVFAIVVCRYTLGASTSGLVVKSNVAIVGPWVRFPASAMILTLFFRSR